MKSQLQLEQRGIDYIPPSERHGRPWTLFTFWGGANVHLVSAVTGTIPIALGLSFWWAAVAIVVGNVVGGLFMAYHSVQGPQLGVPQMIQSRAQFGFYGAVAPVLIVVALYVCYTVLGVIVGGQAWSALTGWSLNPSMIFAAAVMLVVAWVGYDLFHFLNRYIVFIEIALFAAILVKLVTEASGPSLSAGKLTFGTLMLGITAFASWQITYAPYVSDYSRYLPKDTPARTTFWYTYVGSVAGAILPMLAGALGAAVVKGFASSPSAALGALFPGIGGLILFLLFLGTLPANYTNPYGGFLAAVTAFTKSGKVMPTPSLRVIATTIVMAIAVVIAVAASTNFITNLTNYLALILVALVPWTAINLTDFYFVRHGQYETGEFFKVNGLYGAFNTLAVVIFLVTIGIEIPFLNTTVYEGPIAKNVLGGGDISWVVGLVFAAVVYYVLVPKTEKRVVTRADTAPADAMTGSSQPSVATEATGTTTTPPAN